ncbi:MAG: hypothetical protein HDS93_03590 [Bacteroidales bacterium]|nr:hypothetical protein [Bacteroidales bacterium]MBD5190925.1 hypothetical protein [Bacteroidales bacterium]MBD5208562.1 hypothetical protein [Bacteroidales bacterium]MDE6082930.1 hypothetical protein [Muribaculaceae bacterium]
MKENEILTLKYLNEDDRAYGLAGMSVSLAALNAIQRVASVSLDSDGPMVIFGNEYYFSGSPSVSPKATWDKLVENFQITSAMALANVMSRSIVRMHRQVPLEILKEIHDAMIEEGRETCSLEEDETDALFNKMMTYNNRIFNNPRVHPAIDEFVRILSRRRSLTGGEIIDELRNLQLI